LGFTGFVSTGFPGNSAAVGVSLEEGERIKGLLQRGVALAREIERLRAVSIRVLIRVDPDYPARYHQRLKDSAPLVLFYAGDVSILCRAGIAVVGARGVDRISLNAAKSAGSSAAAIIAGSLDFSKWID
jgi:predicted Rossmann fold nucleotide-binding protein DprA/Smf involved in DNA uptake